MRRETVGADATGPTVSRLIDKLGAQEPKVTAIRSDRVEVRQWTWKLAGALSSDAAGQVIVDLDGVLVLAHSDKQDACRDL